LVILSCQLTPNVEEQENFANITGLTTLYREAGELLVYNEGEFSKGFAICLKCGYAESEKKHGQGAINLPTNFQKHAPLTSVDDSKSCWYSNDGAPAFRNQTLAARQTTDALMLDFSQCLHDFANHMAVLSTLAQALLMSGAKLLELDSRELGAIVVPAGYEGKGLGVVLYDNVPGGAGHVLELLSLGRSWLEEAHKTMLVSPEHDKICETACLDCLLTFGAQESMRLGLLQRRLTLQILDALLQGASLPVIEVDTNNTVLFTELQKQSQVAPSVPATGLTAEERRERAAQRRQKGRK
jgi:DEAD/DEAH box helicase domain-containing protein